MRKPKYKLGDSVLVWTNGGVYRRATIVTSASWYFKGKCFGYYINWDPISTNSAGGWVPEHYLKPNVR